MALPQSTNIIIIAVTFSVLAIVAVALRLRARQLQKARLGADDYLILPGLLLAVGYGVNNIVGVQLGNLGSHIELSDDGIPQFDDTLIVYKQTDLAAQLLSIASLTFTKLSIVLFYHRIFASKKFRFGAYIMAVSICIWGVSFFLADLLQCIPTSEIWTSLEGQDGHLRSCYNFIPMFYATAITNMCMDVIILSMPIPMVWKLHMPTGQKIAVTGIFLLGSFILGISAARVYFFFTIGKDIERAWDITYERAPTIYWSMLEAQIAVVCACLPSMGVLFNKSSLQSTVQRFASQFSLFITSRSGSSNNNNSVRKFTSTLRLKRSESEGGQTGSEVEINKNFQQDFNMEDLESQRDTMRQASE